MSNGWSVVILLALFWLIPGNSLANQGIAENDEALKKVQDQITAADKRAKKLEKESIALNQKITDLRQDLMISAKKIQDAEEAVTTKGAHLGMLDVQESDLQKSLKTKYRQMAKNLAAMQRLSRQPAELVAYRPEKVINSLRSASLLKIIQPELKLRADEIQKDMTRLNRVREQISREQEEMASLLEALTSEQIEMNELLAARRVKQKELREATRSERRKLKIFAAQAKNLKDLMVKIKRENKARELTRKKNLKNKYDSRPGAALSFAKAKGRIPLPARGSLTRTYGSKNPEGLSSEGIIIHTLPRAMVISPHEGRIVFAGKFRSYGQLLIIAHGPEYHTLLAGMTRLDVEVGQWVLKGEPIGQMAADKDKAKKTGNISGQNLYVELRQMGKPINLLPWIVARDRKVL